jgi:glycosyltransferase involved in cell wall biosynthesis
MPAEAIAPRSRPGSNRPRVSVVVPFYDRQRHLAECVEALLAQDLDGSVEIILVDNGSSDVSAAAAARERGVTLLLERTPGAYAARNAGIRRAAAPIVAFTDADCTPDRDWLRSVCDGMEDARVAILVGHCRYPAGASPALHLLGAYENAKAEYVMGRLPRAHHFAYANNMAVRASVFEEVGLFAEWDRAADSELVHRLAARRPDLGVAYRESMRVTHLEFLRLRDRLRRLSLYTSTNARIATFRELTKRQRAAVLLRVLLGGGRAGRRARRHRA